MCQVYINLYQAHCHDWIYFKCSLELVHNVWLQEYLHFYCDPPLYHGDVKPSNVFLDKNYLAKVIGAKLCHSLQSLLRVNQLYAFQQLAGGGLVHHCTSSRNTTPSSTPVNVKIQATPGKAHFVSSHLRWPIRAFHGFFDTLNKKESISWVLYCVLVSQ